MPYGLPSTRQATTSRNGLMEVTEEGAGATKKLKKECILLLIQRQ